MKHTRIVVNRYGGPDVLQLVEEECPEPKAGAVRVRMLAAGVSLPDVMMREGIHPERPIPPFTPGWDIVGTVDRLGLGVQGVEPGHRVMALPITGAYAEYMCLPVDELVPVPLELDPAETVCLGLNYITAYQMMHGVLRARSGQSVLVHGASGGVGTALLQLGRLAGLQMFGTCSARGAATVRSEGATPIDYRSQDFVEEVHRLTIDGVDGVFDGIGGRHIWRSRKALRPGGKVVAYGLTGSLSGGRITGARPQRVRGLAVFGLYIMASLLLPGRKRVAPYSIQWLKRRDPERFRRDLRELIELLRTEKVKPIIARRFSLSEARKAQEFLGEQGVVGKIVIVENEVSPQAT